MADLKLPIEAIREDFHTQIPQQPFKAIVRAINLVGGSLQLQIAGSPTYQWYRCLSSVGLNTVLEGQEALVAFFGGEPVVMGFWPKDPGDYGGTPPGTCSVSSPNFAGSPHTHSIASSSNPGAAASLLASDANGYLQLVGLGIGAAPGSADLHFATGVGITHADGIAAGMFLRADGVRYVPDTLDVADITDLAYAAPNLTLGLANAAGVANTVIRTNATILAFDAVVPDVIQCDDAAATGAATVAARRDHTHGIVCAAPGANLAVATTNAEGVATSFARSDHSHAITSSSNPGAAASILASDASGYLQLAGLGIGAAATAANSITFADDGWEGLGPAAGRLVWDSTPTPNEATFLDCNVGIGAAPIVLANLEIITSNTAAEVAIQTYDTNNQDPRLFFIRSNTDTIGSYVTTIDTQNLGEIRFQGIDTGPNIEYGARIVAVQDGAAGAFVPTRLTLYTHTNAGANTDQLVLMPDGGLTVSGPSMTVPDDWWLGFGSAAGRLAFNDLATDELNFLDCAVTIGYDAHPFSHVYSLGLVSSNANTALNLYTFDDGNSLSSLSFYKSDTDAIAYAETDDLDVLGGIYFNGVNTTPIYSAGASIVARQNGAANTDVPTTLTLTTHNALGPNANQLVLASDGTVGVRAPTPGNQMEIDSDLEDGGLIITDHFSSTHAARVHLRRTRGSAGAEAALNDNDWVSSFLTQGWDGAAWDSLANWIVYVPDVASAHGWTRLYTYDGGAAVAGLVMNHLGDVSIGIAAGPSARFHVDNDGAIAQPVLYLDQGDVSEEMIEFATTIGAGNAIEAAGGKTLTTTHFIKVTLPGALTRYVPVGTIA